MLPEILRLQSTSDVPRSATLEDAPTGPSPSATERITTCVPQLSTSPLPPSWYPPATRPHRSRGGCAEIAIVPVALEFTDDPDAWSLILAFEPVSGLVPSFRVLPHPVDLDDAACTALDALGALHVPETAAVDIACGEFEPKPLLPRSSAAPTAAACHPIMDGRTGAHWSGRQGRSVGRPVRSSPSKRPQDGKGSMALLIAGWCWKAS